MAAFPGMDFTEQELRAWMAAPEPSRKAIEALLGRTKEAAEDNFANGATTDREAAVAQGMLRVAIVLHGTVQGAPARFADLANRKPAAGTSPDLGGFV